MSTGQTLSLVTTGVVLVVLATAVVVVWLMLRQTALETTQERLSGSVKQLATVTATSIRTARVRYLAITRDSSVLGVLADSSPSKATVAAARTRLQSLTTPADSGMPVELWTAGGKRVLFVGNDVVDAPNPDVRPDRGDPARTFRPGLQGLRLVDSIQLGNLYHEGERAYSWLVMPVITKGKTVGFLAQQRRIAASAQTERTIKELSGSATVGYYHNADGTGWTSFGGRLAPPPSSIAGGLQSRPGTGQLLHAEARVDGTPLVMAMEIPRDAVLARAQTVVRQLALISVILTMIGALIAWQAGKRIAAPLRSLTGAAESVAQGDYSTRVPPLGGVEVARLATSFNRMAVQIGDARSLLETRENELRTLANAIPQLAWMADAEGRAFWFNDRWYEYTAAPRDQAANERWTEAHDPAAVGEVMRRWKRSVQTGEPFEMEVRLRAANGSYRWFLTRIAPVRDRDENVVRWFGTSTDIQALWEAREAANSANRAKSDFLAAMSHELRTPLNAIGGYVELMEMGVRGPISEQQRRDLARIRISQQHLLSLIGGVLDLNRIESGRATYDVAHVAVDPFLRGLEALVLPQAEAKEQVLGYEPAPDDLVVRADREKLRQILLNLLSNAIRHSPVGTSIVISAERCTDGTVALFVRDNGPGIPADRRESIFEPFVQLDRSLSNPVEGVGLGLAISRDLARGMGGDLTVASTVGSGATFSVILPAGELNERTLMTQTTELPSPTKA